MSEVHIDKPGAGGQPGRPKFQRRVFLVKNRFQVHFALFPIIFFVLFLLGGGAYLYWFIDETLNYYIYLPHCRLDNIWSEVAPAIGHVAAVGGGAFLLVLGLWTWRRYAGLRKDIARMEEWTATFDPKTADAFRAALDDREMQLMGLRFCEAAHRFDFWGAEVERLRVDFYQAARELRNTDDEHLIPALAELNLKWRNLWDEVNRVRIDERFS